MSKDNNSEKTHQDEQDYAIDPMEREQGYGTMDELFSSVGIGNSIIVEKEEGFFTGTLNTLSRMMGALIVAGIMSLSVAIGFFFILSYLASTAEPAVSWYKSLPTDLPEPAIAERNIVYDGNGDQIAEFWVEDRIALDELDDISDHAINALIATEDRRFFDHTGFDVRGIARSAISGSGGGSGITQQLVKNLQFYDRSISEEERFEAIDVSMERKIQELRYAIAYEQDYSKEEILLQYFNVVSFGGPDVYSIESAARFFFGKSAAELELHEASVLIGSVQNTSVFNLQNEESEEAYKNRQAAVLDSMVAMDMITEEEAAEAFEQELDIQANRRSSSGCPQSDYPFFCEYVIDHLRDDPSLGEDAEERNALIAAGGLHIHTTLDPEIHNLLQETSMNALGDDNRVILPMAAVEPGTGEVKGFGFNRDYGSGEGATEINLADSPTGTGSAFKMFTLAAAFENGYNANSLEFNAPCPWQKDGWETPDNGIRNSTGCSGFQSGFMGHLEGTAVSSNTYFVELLSRVGVSSVEDFAESVGLPTPEGQSVSHGSSSYTLGPHGHSPIDVAAAYAAFSAEGVYCPANPISSVQYIDGTKPMIPDSYDPENHGCQRVMSPRNAGEVLKAMRANMDDDIIEGALGADAAVQDHKAVGKSGTNQLYNQAFAMVSSELSIYSNAYDFERPTREIDGYWSDGEYRAWNDNEPQRLTAEVMRDLVGNNTPDLNFDSNDTSYEPVPFSQRDFISVPSVIGMEPEAALSALEGTGLSSFISRDPCVPGEEYENRYPAGVVVGQSIEPGEELPRGTETEIVLCTNR